MRFHVCLFETELAGSDTAARPGWEIYREYESIGESLLIDTIQSESGATELVHLQQLLNQFTDWTATLPSHEPVLFWLSIHGCDQAQNAIVRGKQKATSMGLVPTLAEAFQFGVVQWYNTLAPAIQRAANPGRIVVFMDACWGGSPTAPARMATSAATRPFGVIGPRRAVTRNELDSIFEAVYKVISEHGLSVQHFRNAVDELNSKYPGGGDFGFCRFWTWNGQGQQVGHP